MPAKLLMKAQRNELLQNGEDQREARKRGQSIAFPPVVKLFTPDVRDTRLLSELYPDDPYVAFGLCDLGMGFPELGDVRISAIEAVRDRLNLPVARDRCFTAKETFSEYAQEAHAAQRITFEAGSGPPCFDAHSQPAVRAKHRCVYADAGSAGVSIL